MSKLDNKVALIIGAASGIGQAIATLFQAEGATLALADLDRDACVDLCGPRGSAIASTSAPPNRSRHS